MNNFSSTERIFTHPSENASLVEIFILFWKTNMFFWGKNTTPRGRGEKKTVWVCLSHLRRDCGLLVSTSKQIYQ